MILTTQTFSDIINVLIKTFWSLAIRGAAMPPAAWQQYQPEP
jgi:hypothetical protein